VDHVAKTLILLDFTGVGSFPLGSTNFRASGASVGKPT
jgi:hypothetical protein